MKLITIISAIVVISLLVASNAIHQEKSQRDITTIIEILKDNNQLHQEVIELQTRLQACSASKDTIPQYNGYYARIRATQPELGSAEWYPTHDEWTTLTTEEKNLWEDNYNKF